MKRSPARALQTVFVAVVDLSGLRAYFGGTGESLLGGLRLREHVHRMLSVSLSTIPSLRRVASRVELFPLMR